MRTSFRGISTTFYRTKHRSSVSRSSESTAQLFCRHSLTVKELIPPESPGAKSVQYL